MKNLVMASFFEELPDDILALVSSRICYTDICNLMFTCRRFRNICNADKLWYPQCNKLLQNSTTQRIDLQAWRQGMHSYKALFRFMNGVKSLLGIWVHQNPELGNLVYVTWGFLSVAGCRIVPQELGSKGLDSGLLWAPVFEILAVPDGSLAFFLHGRDKDKDDHCYPGRVTPAKDDCNVLLLEAQSFTEPVFVTEEKPESPDSPLVGLEICDEQVAVKSSSSLSSAASGKQCDKQQQLVQQQLVEYRLQQQGGGGGVSFGRLSFGDRRRLLDMLVWQIRIKVPALAHGPLFLRCLRPGKKEMKTIKDRHALLLWMYAHGDPKDAAKDSTSVGYSGIVDSELLIQKLRARTSYIPTDRISVAPTAKGNGFATYVKAKVRQMMMMGYASSSSSSSSSHGARKFAISKENADKKKVQLDEYLKQSKAVGLRLHGTSLKLTHYRAWPIMSENRFALYKMQQQNPHQEGREYAGIWGGTLGWPPGKASEGKSGTPLFFLLLSYDQSEDGSSRLLIGTKILEGTHYVVHPNGSAMFTVKVNEASSERFPWSSNGDGTPVDIVGAYHGEGISSGYGFRYPGAKPGDLFVDANGCLAFVWRESKAVLTLQRLNLEDLLRKGERVGALSAIANFAYLTKANSNVFAGYSGALRF